MCKQVFLFGFIGLKEQKNAMITMQRMAEHRFSNEHIVAKYFETKSTAKNVNKH